MFAKFWLGDLSDPFIIVIVIIIIITIIIIIIDTIFEIGKIYIALQKIYSLI